MNTATNVSRALALVTPRPVGQRTAAVPPEMPAAAFAVLARVPDLRNSAREPSAPERAVVAHVPAKPFSQEKPAYDRPGFSLPSIHWPRIPIDRRTIVQGLTACWIWAVGVPPIVKLGAAAISLVMGIWMMNREPEKTVTHDHSAWQISAGEASPTAAIGPAARTATAGNPTWRWDGAPVAASTDPAFPNDPRGGPIPERRDELDRHAHGTRTIGESGRAGAVPVGVHPVETYRQPYDDREMAAREVEREARVRSIEEDRPPPEMGRRWSERPSATDRSDVPGVQYNQHVGQPEHYIPAPVENRARSTAATNDHIRVANANEDPSVALARRRAFDSSRQSDARNTHQPIERR